MMIAGGIATAVAMLARRVRRLQVAGDSMRPTLEPGEHLLVLRTHRLRPGDLAVVADPRAPQRLVVKRVLGVSPDGALVVRGDNPGASTDSRTFGPVGPDGAIGRVLYRYHPASRRGRIPRLVP